MLGLLARWFALGTMPMFGSAQEAKARSWCSPPPGSRTATASGWSPARPSPVRPVPGNAARGGSEDRRVHPRLAEKWSASPDFKEWTFILRKGVSSTSGTAVHRQGRRALALPHDAAGGDGDAGRVLAPGRGGQGRQRPPGRVPHEAPSTTMPYAVSRAGDLRIVSKAQWDKEGRGFDKRPAGTGSYRYVGRQPGLSVTFERVDNHWGEKPAFKSWSSGWPARSRRGWRCCCPARPTSPTCPASCRRTRSRRA